MNLKSSWTQIRPVLPVGVVGAVFALRIVRKLKRLLSPSLVLAALSIGLCQASLGQGDADLDASSFPI